MISETVKAAIIRDVESLMISPSTAAARHGASRVELENAMAADREFAADVARAQAEVKRRGIGVIALSAAGQELNGKDPRAAARLVSLGAGVDVLDGTFIDSHGLFDAEDASRICERVAREHGEG